MDDEPRIPAERPYERVPLTPDEISRILFELDLTAGEFSRRWDIKRRRVPDVAGSWQDMSAAAENGLLLLRALVHLKEAVEAMPADAGLRYAVLELEAAAIVLERVTGKRYDNPATADPFPAIEDP